MACAGREKKNYEKQWVQKGMNKQGTAETITFMEATWGKAFMIYEGNWEGNGKELLK